MRTTPEPFNVTVPPATISEVGAPVDASVIVPALWIVPVPSPPTATVTERPSAMIRRSRLSTVSALMCTAVSTVTVDTAPGGEPAITTLY